MTMTEDGVRGGVLEEGWDEDDEEEEEEEDGVVTVVVISDLVEASSAIALWFIDVLLLLLRVEWNPFIKIADSSSYVW